MALEHKLPSSVEGGRWLNGHGRGGGVPCTPATDDRDRERRDGAAFRPAP